MRHSVPLSGSDSCVCQFRQPGFAPDCITRFSGLDESRRCLPHGSTAIIIVVLVSILIIRTAPRHRVGLFRHRAFRYAIKFLPVLDFTSLITTWPKPQRYRIPSDRFFLTGSRFASAQPAAAPALGGRAVVCIVSVGH